MERMILEWVVRADMLAERSMTKALEMYLVIGRFAMGVIFVFGALALIGVAVLARMDRANRTRMKQRWK